MEHAVYDLIFSLLNHVYALGQYCKLVIRWKKLARICPSTKKRLERCELREKKENNKIEKKQTKLFYER